MDKMCDNKYKINNIIQEMYDEFNRNIEKHNQYKCETDLTLRENINIIRRQEEEITERDMKINDLETEVKKHSIKNNEYEVMIRDLEDKINEMIHEKEEENRFDILRVQAKTILEKENEIERLLLILNKKQEKKEDKNVNNVIDMINNTNLSECDIDITDKSESDKDESDKDDSEEDDDYEIVTYRKKEYWINKNENNPQYVYEVLEENGEYDVGDKLGTYEKGKNGKMKVVLNKN